MSEATDRFKKLVADFDARVQAAPAEAWDNQSPCADWKARDVVVHVGNNFRHFAGMEPVSADGDVVAEWNASRDAIEGLVDTGDLSRVVDGPFGPMPVDQLLDRILATDTLVHTWDLARAVGGDERLDAEAVAGSYSGLKPMDAMLRGGTRFGDKLEPPAGADEQTEFLMFLGRSV
jgi:uncharacterized protein (TIGR03086 family)